MFFETSYKERPTRGLPKSGKYKKPMPRGLFLKGLGDCDACGVKPASTASPVVEATVELPDAFYWVAIGLGLILLIKR